MTKGIKALFFIMALLIYGGLFWFVMSRDLSSGIHFDTYITYGKVIGRGWLTTIYISMAGVLLALFVGLILYLMEEVKSPFLYILKYIAVIHKNIIFGTPLLVIAIVSYYYVGNAFGISNKTVVGIIVLGLYIGAYISDIYKGAIESIHINQWQTAKMFGFTRYQTYRYIVFPQVIVSILPALAGQLALTIKGSALLAYMATSEFFNSVNNVMAISFNYPAGFIVMSAGYWLITIPLIMITRRFEDRVNFRKSALDVEGGY